MRAGAAGRIKRHAAYIVSPHGTTRHRGSGQRREALIMTSFHCESQALYHTTCEHSDLAKPIPHQWCFVWRVGRGGPRILLWQEERKSYNFKIQPLEDTCQEHFESRTPIKNSTPISTATSHSSEWIHFSSWRASLGC